jgi:predicted nucleic acid-binding protein
VVERRFFDTNILIYAHDTSDPHKHAIAASLVADAFESRSGTLSTQVLQEFYATSTGTWRPSLARAEARLLVSAYAEWPLVTIDATLIVIASELEEAQSLSFWDSLIVEAAKRAGATVLLSEDMQHGRSFGSILVENPFRAPALGDEPR